MFIKSECNIFVEKISANIIIMLPLLFSCPPNKKLLLVIPVGLNTLLKQCTVVTSLDIFELSQSKMNILNV